MSCTLDELAADIHHALPSDSGLAGKAAVWRLVSRVLTIRVSWRRTSRTGRPDPILAKFFMRIRNPAFASAATCTQARPSARPMITASWAIYGQATGTTEMTDWKIVEKGDAASPSLVEAARTYVMHPGDVRSRNHQRATS